MSQQHKLYIISLIAAIISIGAVSMSLSSILAQEGETFSASLSGKDAVPPTESSATGWAKFQTDDNGTQVSYWVNITGLNEIGGAHIHNGSAGQTGDVVVSLSGPESAENGDDAMLSLKGNITKDDLKGPLEGSELSEMVGLMSDGMVYVNVHTDEFQDGAIRGQITRIFEISEFESGWSQMENNGTSVASNTTSDQ